MRVSMHPLIGLLCLMPLLIGQAADVVRPTDGITLEQYLEAARAEGAFIFIDGLHNEKMREVVSPHEGIKAKFTTSYYEIVHEGNEISVRPRDESLHSLFLDRALPPLSFDHVDLEQVVARVGLLTQTKLTIDTSRPEAQPITLKTSGCTVREFLKTLAEAMNSRQVILSYAIGTNGKRATSFNYVFF